MHVPRKPPAKIQRLRNKVHSQIRRTLKIAFGRLRPRRVLDVGTGFGQSVELLSRRFGKTAQIWSIDASPQVLQEVRRTLREKRLSKSVRFRRARAEALPFSARHFDLVVSWLSLHHLSNPRKGLREMARVLADGGKLIVVDWKPGKSAATPHSAKDIPSPQFVIRVLNQVDCSVVLQQGRYWYLVEATK